ncbi:MAG: FHA domain-containing protein [Eubacterium sp.]|nr:FHA domain-containing protein [Eubacterium sp.]
MTGSPEDKAENGFPAAADRSCRYHMAEPATMLLDGEMIYGYMAGRNRLIAGNGGGNPSEISLTRENYLIGKKGKGADIGISSPAVSRVHARLQRKDGGYTLRDMNSRNGTWVNGEMLLPGQTAALRKGDRIRFADAEYHYQ